MSAPGTTAWARSVTFMEGMRGTSSSPPCMSSKVSITICTACGRVMKKRVQVMSVIGSGLPSSPRRRKKGMTEPREPITLP